MLKMRIVKLQPMTEEKGSGRAMSTIGDGDGDAELWRLLGRGEVGLK